MAWLWILILCAFLQATKLETLLLVTGCERSSLGGLPMPLLRAGCLYAALVIAVVVAGLIGLVGGLMVFFH